MNTYKTIDIARIIGIHVNTVRLYEKCGLIPKPERLENGYRVFTDLHIEQFKLARAALQVEVLQNGLRKQAVDIIKVSALGNYEKAMEQMHTEKGNTIFIGDQIFTDIYGANRAGIRTYLVQPIHPKEEIQIVLKRYIERIVLFFYHRRNKR